MSLSFSQRLGLRVGIEELTEGATGDVLDEVSNDIGRDALLDGDSLEKNFDAVTGVSDDIDKYERTASSLETIVLALESMSNPTLCGDTYRFYNLSLENALVVSGNTASDADKASDGDSPAVNKNKIMAMLEAIWVAIKSLYVKLTDTIKGWLMHLFDTAGRMRKHVQALQSKLNGVKDNPNAKLTANHHALFIGDTFPENALILNNVESMADVSSKVLTGEFSLSKDTFIKELVQVYKDMPQERNIRGQTVMLIDLSSYDKLKLYLVTHLRGLANDANMSSKDVPKEMQEDMTDKVFTRTPETFGNRIQYITLPVEDKNAKEPSTFKEWISKVRFASTVVRHTPKEDSPVSVMPVTDIAASCKELIKTLDNIIKYKELWFKGVQTRLKYVAGLNDVAKDWTLRDVNLGLAFDTPEQLAAFQAKSPEEQAKEAVPGIAKFTKTAGDVAGGIMGIIGKQDGFEANVCKNLMRSCSDVIHYLSDCTQAHAGK